MKTKVGILLSLFLLALVGCQSQPTEPEAEATGFKKFHTIADNAYVKKYAILPKPAGVQIIDARPKARKYDSGHIPGAMSLPDSQFDKLANTLPADKSTQLIFYCGGLKCKLSHSSAFKAEKLGYSNIKVYAKGFPDWKKNGGLVAVSIDRISKLKAKGADMVLVDARPGRKFKKGTIPDAINIPDSQFDKKASMLPADKAKPLYFFCGGLKCKLSSKSANKAIKLGHKKVRIIPMGYPGWKKAYGKGKRMIPTIKSDGEDGTISIASFKEIMANAPESILLVDVRDKQEFGLATIPGAINIPVNDLEKKMDTLPADKPIVFFCGTGGRAGEAYDMLQMFKPELKAYFLNAEVDIRKDGYTLKAIE